MIRALLTVSTGTLASRLLGFARDAMVAALLGAGPVADAFLVAFQMVNVIRRLLTEGALNAALIPGWLRVRAAQGEIAAAAFAGRVLGTISVALVAVTLLIGFAMPVVIALLAPGFVGEATLQMAVDDARLMLPYLAFAGPVTVMMGLLNAQHRFALTAFSPLLFNIALIAVMTSLLAWRQDAATAALLIAATVGIAGLLQLAMLLRRGPDLATPLRVVFDAEMRGFLRQALPGMVASSGPQLLIVAGAVIASHSPSVVSWLYFANRLIELPLGIVGTAMGTVLVPELTRAVRSDDNAAIGHAESRGLELAVGLALPATLGLMVLSQPIVQLLFEHGAFDATDTAATAQALLWLALGLPAHVLVKALSPAFFARDDTMTPLWATLIGLAVAIVAALALRRFGAAGIAAAIALAAWSSAAVLIARSTATFGFSLDGNARRRLPRIVLAAFAMGALLWLKAGFVWPWAAQAHGMAQAALLGLLIAGGLLIYAALLAIFGVVTPADIRRAIQQSHSGDLRG
ncbi:murein biosynthesis integral membrane protein MurJ [Tardiphaga sp. vice352]|uniref:murein biosynthesis integral membrane protein MurJ n=1 Tax=unclassified Tardiphaga TaxID=2631404 RepID=UPI001163306C|nr:MULTISPECIES: murein biosynthesis integral membrane protein MurJ [unclassified Tardiphaga]QDM14645.1 murein biosynthesis integral membrane protein MurJ [Tardiphaga sp. vice278]QDM19803.1 murein biosynthesis integral membrane protein MurJ [Tardiphaga sp. vice154]QDM24823.1 murein biosynthesis integral membrane protein MurJ [Tardiphaga sp. vice304]QDM30033.1 murein biosynthesis integral membrane protein MurJ [Tardiphaga sp. vice352]